MSRGRETTQAGVPQPTHPPTCTWCVLETHAYAKACTRTLLGAIMGSHTDVDGMDEFMKLTVLVAKDEDGSASGDGGTAVDEPRTPDLAQHEIVEGLTNFGRSSSGTAYGYLDFSAVVRVAHTHTHTHTHTGGSRVESRVSLQKESSAHAAVCRV